jgi:putative ABC transport system ATP-binding protein
MLVEIRDLKAGYGGEAVVTLDQLSIGHGEHTLILGPSGCGKTTLLNVIAGLAAPQSGEISVEGTALARLNDAGRDAFRGRTMGLVMQRLHLIRALRVEDNLRLAQSLTGRPHDEQAIGDTLAALGVADKRRRYPRELSQGEMQRVAIARAVINRPPLILADEPTSALDDANCRAVIALLFAQATRYGATLIVATHDARLRPHFANVVTLA